MNQALDNFLKLKEATFKPETVRYYKGKIPTIKKFMGNLDVEEVTDVDIADFLLKLKERNPEISKRTQRKYVDIIMSIVNKGKKEADKLKFTRPKPVLKKIKKVSDENIALILNYYVSNLSYANNHKYYLLINLLLDTGVRINELVNIKMKNINLSMNSIHLDVTKTDSDRTVYFSDRTRQILLSYINKHIDGHEYLFYSQDGKGHIHRDSVYKSIARLQKRLNIKQSISPHKFRHAFATKLLRKTGDIEVVRQLLGHKHLETTQIYLDYEDEYLKKVYDKAMNNNGMYNAKNQNKEDQDLSKAKVLQDHYQVKCDVCNTDINTPKDDIQIYCPKCGSVITVLHDKDNHAYAIETGVLVASSFLPGEPKKYVIHKDGNRGNNNVANLQWSDHPDYPSQDKQIN
ncbi:tyrosine-type recombinase/integrase [Candidatus Xianfuyuplasma coldseepsis]|nr:tyrosine-type recombinase/integrase [Xianfuyuplasma coldseepsis]